MAQFYTNPARASDPHALPNAETFYVTRKEALQNAREIERGSIENGATEPGWYWWACFPGCMPDGEPNGPFETEEAAIADAQDEEGE
jgi:hypothetical protein